VAAKVAAKAAAKTAKEPIESLRKRKVVAMEAAAADGTQSAHLGKRRRLNSNQDVKRQAASCLVAEEEALYQVEALLAVRLTPSGTREFCVRWLGYGSRADSWEPEANIIDPQLIRTFDQQPVAAQASDGKLSDGGVNIGGGDGSDADNGIVRQLAMMGFSQSLCQRAAIATRNAGASSAIEWLLSKYRRADPDRAEHALPPPVPEEVACRNARSAASAGHAGRGVGASTSSGMACRGLWKSAAASGHSWPRLGPDHQAELPQWLPGHAAEGTGSALQQQPSVDVATAFACDVAATLTAAAYGPLGSFCFVSPCDCGLGLFARVQLQASQYICEYDGPRLPLRLQVHGQYVLEVPGTSFVIDGASENSPFECERSPAVYANHSAAPNARLEIWPVARAGPLEVRERMVLVASEPIAAGQEVRIDYEGGNVANYWHVLGEVPVEGPWRTARVRAPPSFGTEPVYHSTHKLQAGSDEPCSLPWQRRSPIPWEGSSGGDARLHAIVPLLSTNYRQANASAWPLVSTHVPGRSGRECRDRWQMIQHLDENSGWLQTPASRAVSHTEAAANMARKNREAALASLAAAHDDSSDDGDDAPRVRCCISGCKRQLLSCSGRKHGGSAVGCAEECHYLCAPCLYTWLASETTLRAERGLNALTRRTCPVCKSEIRAASSAVRAEADRYVMGLQKVADTW